MEVSVYTPGSSESLTLAFRLPFRLPVLLRRLLRLVPNAGFGDGLLSRGDAERSVEPERG